MSRARPEANLGSLLGKQLIGIFHIKTKDVSKIIGLKMHFGDEILTVYMDSSNRFNITKEFT